MKHKASIMRYLIVAMLTVMCAVLCFVGCKDETTGGKTDAEHTVTWTVAEHATVKAEGYETLPEKVKDGTAIVFTVECDNGYEVDTVKRGDRNVTASSGKYTVTVTADVTISVTLKEQLKSLNVTTNPTKLTYYAGEVLDKAGMVVEAEYATGTKKPVTDYRVVYPTENATCFYLGDKSFTVSYSGMTSAPVELTAPVEAKVTINPVGGVINEEILTLWEGRTDLHDYEVATDGTISFTYLKLDSALTLPTNAEILLGDGKSSSLAAWVDGEGTAYTEIGLDNKVSLDLHANWNVILVDMQKMELVMEGGKPYLALTLSVNTDFSAYIFFYEGNDKTMLKGEEIEGKRGETITSKFDLTLLQKETVDENGKPVSAEGSWMDIRVNTTINGIDVSQTFAYDPDDPLIQYGQMIHDDEYCYRFIHYMNEGKADLKVYYNKYLTTYTMEVQDVSGKPTLVMNGQANTKREAAKDFPFEGAKIDITFGSAIVTGTAKADGSWEATLDLTTLGQNFAATATTVMMTSADGSKTLDLGKGGKLDLIGSGTIFENFDATAGSNQNFYNEWTIGGFRCTVGTDWNEPRLTVKDIAHEIAVTGADLDVQEGVVYFVLTGTYGSGFASADEVKAAIYLDIQSNSDAGSPDGWNVYWASTNEDNGMQLTATGGTWTLKVAIPEEAQKDGVFMFSHFGDSGSNLVLAGVTTKSVIVGDLRYTISNWTTWGSQLVSIAVEHYDPTAKSITLTSDDVDLVEEGGKPCIVVTVLAENYTEDELKAAVKYGNEDSNNGFSWKTPCIKVVKDGNKYKLYFDLTEMQVGGDGQLWSNLFIPDGDTEKKVEIHDDNLSTNGKTITVNGKKYTIICTGDNGTWRIPCIKVENV